MMRKLPFPHRLLPVGLLHESTAATATKSPNQSFRIVPPAVELDLYGTPQNYRGLRPWPEPPVKYLTGGLSAAPAPGYPPPGAGRSWDTCRRTSRRRAGTGPRRTPAHPAPAGRGSEPAPP